MRLQQQDLDDIDLMLLILVPPLGAGLLLGEMLADVITAVYRKLRRRPVKVLEPCDKGLLAVTGRKRP